MKEISLDKKTGFIIDEPFVPVIINDDRGIYFYSNVDNLPGECFNLPPGSYQILSGVFHEISTPIVFKLATLPRSEVLLPPNVRDFEIVFAKNPNKCTIFYHERMIVFDDSFQTGPKPNFEFVLQHEYGHSYFGYGKKYDYDSAEAFCDLYASNQMLKMGYNPSQIARAQQETLSHRQDYRKDFVEDILEENAFK